MSTSKKKIERLAVLSVLSALTAIVSFMPLKALGLEITFSMIPVAIGAILYGPTGGAVLGGVFGIVSFLQCLGWSPFGAMILGINPFYTFLVCVPTRILAGFFAGAVYKGLRKVCKTDIPALLCSSFLAPFLNTLFFMAVLILCFYNTDFIQGIATNLGAANPFMFVVLFVWINGLVEILCGFIVSFPCAKALSKYLKL